MLFHVSENGAIERFAPRPHESGGDSVVWAIDEQRLRNYLVPRECPRVTFYAGPETTAADKEHFLGDSPAVVAVEYDWYDRLRSCILYCYNLPSGTFQCIDEGAGYFVSRDAVTPLRVDVVNDAVEALSRRNAELRLLPTLWPLRDAVVASSLQFSLIRMRNASPREAT
jgi:hypothetical protein